MATHVVYGDIRFHNCLTRDWHQEIRYDESGTDLLFTKIRMTFQGVAHLQHPEDEPIDKAVCWIGPEGPAGTPKNMPELWKYIHQRLREPRLPLRVYLDDDLFLFVGPADGMGAKYPTRDADAGPKPIDVSITSIAGTQLFNVRFTIEVAILPECADQKSYAGRGAIVISNRWSVSESMDDSFYVTRTIRGRMRLSHPVLPASEFKYLMVPALENGFRRDSIEFTVAANGLDCDYTVRDVQSQDAPPWPVVKWNVVHRETTNDGVTWFTDISIRLDGAPSTPKGYLMMRAVQIILNRMNWEQRGFKDLQTKAFVDGVAFVDHIGDKNTVEVQFRVRRLIEESKNDVVAAVKQRFGTPLQLPPLKIAGYRPSRKGWPPEHDITQHPIPALFGYNPHGGVRNPSVLMLLHCYLQHPCSEHAIWHGTPAQSRSEDDKERRTYYQPTISGYEADQLPEYGESAVSDEASKLLYTFAAAETAYRGHEMIAACPIADYSDDSQNDSSQTDTATEFVVLARPQTMMEVHMEVEAVGRHPAIPEPVESWSQKTTRGTLRGRLLAWEFIEAAPKPTPEGTQLVYRAETKSIYALNRKPLRDEALEIAYLPTVKFKPTERAIDRSKFYDKNLGPYSAGSE